MRRHPTLIRGERPRGESQQSVSETQPRADHTLMLSEERKGCDCKHPATTSFHRRRDRRDHNLGGSHVLLIRANFSDGANDFQLANLYSSQNFRDALLCMIGCVVVLPHTHFKCIKYFLNFSLIRCSALIASGCQTSLPCQDRDPLTGACNKFTVTCHDTVPNPSCRLSAFHFDGCSVPWILKRFVDAHYSFSAGQDSFPPFSTLSFFDANLSCEKRNLRGYKISQSMSPISEMDVYKEKQQELSGLPEWVSQHPARTTITDPLTAEVRQQLSPRQAAATPSLLHCLPFRDDVPLSAYKTERVGVVVGWEEWMVGTDHDRYRGKKSGAQTSFAKRVWCW